MSQQPPETDSDEVTQLGAPRLVCRISRRTLFWAFLLAALPGVVGVALLLFVTRLLLDDWSGDIFGSVLLLSLGVLSLWGCRALWRKANRLRHVQVVVHAGGLSYRDGSTCLTCRWDQVEEVRWRTANHYEEVSLTVGGVLPVPGAAIRRLSHTSYHVTVRRKGGSQLVFTNELQNIDGLARAIQQETSPGVSGEAEAGAGPGILPGQRIRAEPGAPADRPRESSQLCPHCGTQLPVVRDAFCPDCRSPLDDGT
jgi:hypothetical protein